MSDIKNSARIEGIVRFNIRKRPKNKNRQCTIKTFRGKIVEISFGNLIIQGIDIPGLYNRPLEEVDMVVSA